MRSPNLVDGEELEDVEVDFSEERPVVFQGDQSGCGSRFFDLQLLRQLGLGRGHDRVAGHRSGRLIFPERNINVIYSGSRLM